MEACTIFSGEKKEVSLRVGQYEDEFYYYLNENEFVKINKEGYQIVDEVPVEFITNALTLPQVKPNSDGKYGINDFKSFINIRGNKNYLLFIICMISLLIPNIPKFIIILKGVQGSSKSTLTRLIKAIIDPSPVDLYTFPKNKEDMALHLDSSYLIAYDNLEMIKSTYNPLLCQAATGGLYVTRKFFTNKGLVVMKLNKALILNGINIPVVAMDALDRAVVFECLSIPAEKRRTEKELMQDFEEKLPYFLHDIFTIISDAMEIMQEGFTVEELPRMADSALWCCAIAEAIGVGKETLLELLEQSKKDVNEEVLSENVVAYTLITFMRDIEEKWEGSVTELWKKLRIIVQKEKLNEHDATWAKTPSYLSRYLNKLKENLKKENIYFDIVNAGQYRKITLWKKN